MIDQTEPSPDPLNNYDRNQAGNLSRTGSRCTMTNTLSAPYDYYVCAICYAGKSEDNFLSRYCWCK